MGGGCLGVTALRGGHADPFDEPMNRAAGPAGVRLQPRVRQRRDGARTTYDTTAGFRSVHPGGCHFLFCDGSVRFVRESMRADTYRALSTIAGGEVTADPDKQQLPL